MRNRVRQRAFERFERLEGKSSRAVLRGREVSNDLLLPDHKVLPGEKISELAQSLVMYCEQRGMFGGLVDAVPGGTTAYGIRADGRACSDSLRWTGHEK